MQARGANLWPALPGAPTIGTATAASSTSASVTFTAPADTGYPTTLTYTVTSSPGGLTATGSASPLTVTGLTAGTTYTFTVTATNATGTGVASAASNSVTPLPAPGEAFGGGYYVGNIVQGGSTYAIIVSPRASGQSSGLQWKTSQTAGPSATQTLNNGPAASASMNSATYPAAQFCEGLTIGGFSDWYLPARDELELCYRNLKPTTSSNSTDSRSKSSITYPEGNDASTDKMGVNRNSSPTGAAYTSGTPAQTSTTLFKSGNAEAFNFEWYLSSSEFSTSSSWIQNFTASPAGAQNPINKTEVFPCVRAVRRVAI